MTETYKIFNKQKHTDITLKVKDIIFYCTKCGYVLSYSKYNTMEEILEDANCIRYYGNEPSVRRAIRLLNKDNKVNKPLSVLMSEKCRQRLERLESKKKQNTLRFKITHKPVTLIFE